MNDPSRRRRIDWIIIGLAAAATLASSAMVARASETIKYSYDARGRLKQVAHDPGLNANVVTNYSYDKADNRTNKTTSGAP